MKFHLAPEAKSFVFTGSGLGYVSVNGQRYAQNMIVTPKHAQPWGLTNLGALSQTAFESVPTDGADVILLGTGKAFALPELKLLKALKVRLAARGAGLEVMDTPAACRTYNILCEEGRQVVAAVIVE